MPYLAHSDYRAPGVFRNAHLNTIFPAVFRSVASLPTTRLTIPTPDGDFIDTDWVRQGSSRLMIALHGLEGDANRPYMRGILRIFHRAGWDVVGMNFRSCSGRMNERLRMYNMGESGDLRTVVQHAIGMGYGQIILTGFSLGGNVVLKYMGESGRILPSEVKGAVAFSVPCDIPSANIAFSQPRNAIYLHRFLRTLNEKARNKYHDFPGHLVLPASMPRNFGEFDAQFTGPMHGYAHAEDYWHSCSSVHFLPNIHRPVLLINAQDDTFLQPPCFPVALASKHPWFYLETPAHGGHCGFYTRHPAGIYWHEQRALDFVQEVCFGAG
ncbi:MAG: alpha/beta fold hydrolase [Saprospiraceae bacterium]